MDILKTTSTFDKNVGAYACEITLVGPVSDLISLVKSDELQFVLVVSRKRIYSNESNLSN